MLPAPTSGRTGSEPRLVAQVKFTEWTADAKLRHPVYLGLRDDKDPREVVQARKRRSESSASVARNSRTTSGSAGPPSTRSSIN